MESIKELKQNSPEWHEWRKGGIGASEANIIMGKSKFMSPRQLWSEKVFGKKEEEGSNFIQEKGHRLERKARPLFEMEIDQEFPDMIAVHADHPWLRASLDGYCTKTNELWECKFVGQEDFEKVKNGQVLPQYYPQIQHQLMVTGGVCNYLYVIADDKEKKEEGSSWPFKTAYIKVFPDMEYINLELMTSLMEFWHWVCEKIEPEISELDYQNLDSNVELYENLRRYEVVKGHLEKAEKEKKELEKVIWKNANHNKNICRGIKMTQSKSDDKAVFDYKKFESQNPIEKEYLKIQKGRLTKRITFQKI